MSKTLHEKYLKNENVDITKLVFRLEELPDFIHYFSSNENINNLINISSEIEFEFVYLDFAGDPGSCEKCFKEYLSNSTIEEKIIELLPSEK